MSTYSLTYEFKDLPLLGTGARHVTGKVFVAADPITTDYFFEHPGSAGTFPLDASLPLTEADAPEACALREASMSPLSS